VAFSVSVSLARRIAALANQLERLPEASEPPPTTLQVLGRGQQERDWQRLLVHFLSPDEAHGLGHDLLECLLDALADRDDLDYTFSRFDLDDIEVEQEVVTAQGRPDVVIWSAEDWFICWELKIDSAEGDDQTMRYVDVESFGSIGVEKGAVPDERHYYVYLAPDDAAAPRAEEFVHVRWEWVATTLGSFLTESHGAYPARTTAQISDFADTIRDELRMTKYQENQQEKSRLYVDHYEEITAVQRAFDEQWAEFTRNWGRRLAREVDAAEVVSDTGVPEPYVPVDLAVGEARQRWVFRQGTDDWGYLIPHGWWRNVESGQAIYETTKPNARIGFLHRLEQNRERALEDRELVFYLRNAPSGHAEFYDGFAARFNTAADIPELLPSATKRPGVKSNVLEARYDIDTDRHSDFLEAYLAALAEALDDHAVSNPALVRTTEQIYERTLNEDVTL
jgi:hypothetical protein